jgi:steroid 5-alpha reductase family enzyme
MLLQALVESLGLLLLMMVLFFLGAQVLKDNSIVDIAWGLGFVLVAFYTLIRFEGAGARPLVMTLLVGLWGLRLAFFILGRGRGKGEDPRYAKFREKWGRRFLINSFIYIFMMQGVLILVVGLPIVIVNSSAGGDLGVLEYLGAGIFLFGLIFESVSDFQLDRFKKDPANKGKIMDRGLWRYSRHPNYFGEVVLWWGIFVFSSRAPHALIGIIGPLAITSLILLFSGVPILERRFEGRPGYEEYKHKTSRFIHWFPKHK